MPEDEEIVMPVQASDTAGKKKRYLQAGLAAACVLLLLGAVLWIWLSLKGPTALDASVEGTVYSVTAAMDGRISKVPAVKNKIVQAGSPVILLDDAYLRASLAEQSAKLKALRSGIAAISSASGAKQRKEAEDAIRTRMQSARNQETAAQSDLEQLSVEHARMQLEMRRLNTMHDGRPSPTTINQARLAELTAREALEDAQRKFDQISHSRATADGELNRYHAELLTLARMPAEQREEQVKTLESGVHDAQNKLAAATLTTPISGFVLQLSAKAGTAVSKGQVLAQIAPKDPENIWITAHFDSKHVAKIKVGDPCIAIFPEKENMKVSCTVADIGQQTDNSVSVPVRISLSDYNPEDMPVILPGAKVTVRMGRI